MDAEEKKNLKFAIFIVLFGVLIMGIWMFLTKKVNLGSWSIVVKILLFFVFLLPVRLIGRKIGLIGNKNNILGISSSLFIYVGYTLSIVVFIFGVSALIIVPHKIEPYVLIGFGVILACFIFLMNKYGHIKRIS